VTISNCAGASAAPRASRCRSTKNAEKLYLEATRIAALPEVKEAVAKLAIEPVCIQTE